MSGRDKVSSSSNRRDSFPKRYDNERSRSRERDRGRSRSRERYRDRPRSRERDRDHRSRSREKTYKSSSRTGKDGRSENTDDRYAARNNDKKHKSIGRNEESSKLNGQGDITEKEERTDEETLRTLELFANEEEIDEEKEAERLILERKRRREEILRKHQKENNDGNELPLEQAMATVESKTVPNISEPTNKSEANSIVTDHVLVLSNGNGAGMLLQHDTAGELAAERDVVAAEMKESTLFDIFSSSPSDKELLNKQGHRKAMKTALLEGEDPHLQSNWDDGEGYYKPRIGEIISERYLTRGVIGKGVFSTVLLCQDTRNEGVQVAVKMIRNNDTMRKAAEKEVQLLTEIANGDPENKKHCVRLMHHMEYRNHVTMVFEPLQMNLRDTIKKFGKNVGINVTAVRMYARQLLIGLKHLSDLRIVHADIKPDNILVSEDLKQVKLCDFGSAFRETDTDNDPTPYLISRFYRAPEVILGLNYDRMVDLWSLGTCFFELFTGHVMFPGRTNNDMLKLMMEVKGRFPNRLLRAHLRSYEGMSLEPHFQEDFRFRQWEADPLTGKAVVRVVDITQPTRELSSMLLSSKAGADDRRLVTGLADLLEKSLHLDPSKRLTVSEALKHAFFGPK